MGLEFGKHGIEGTSKERDEQITAQTEEERIEEDGKESDRILSAIQRDDDSDFMKNLYKDTKSTEEILAEDIMAEDEYRKSIEENEQAIAETRKEAKKMEDTIKGLFD